MDKIKQGSLGNFDRQLDSCSEVVSGCGGGTTGGGTTGGGTTGGGTTGCEMNGAGVNGDEKFEFVSIGTTAEIVGTGVEIVGTGVEIVGAG